MYTPIIALADLENYIYAEKITAITRGNSAIVDDAIASAITEAISYLGRFNTIAMFGDIVNNLAATMPADQFLNELCCHLACWKIAKLANVGIDLTVLKTSYDEAIATLRRIQEVRQTPPNWPTADLNTIQLSQVNTVHATGRNKRSNNF